jgi:hypothetical protein
MPLRPFNREQIWLLPPTLGELIPDNYPARFVAEFVDAIDGASWVQLGIGLDGEPLGAPVYHPRVLLSVWLYGFMSGIRSSRKLEAACRDIAIIRLGIRSIWSATKSKIAPPKLDCRSLRASKPSSPSVDAAMISRT